MRLVGRQMALVTVSEIFAERILEMLSRFLHTKARASQVGLADPLVDGAESSDKRSRALEYKDARDRCDKDTTSRLR